MNSLDFQDQLARRALLAEITLSAELAGQLETYYRLLVHWNAGINLTALPLSPISDHAVDRLFIEPVAAAQLPSTVAPVWFDLGSGAGSPAIPLKLARPAGQLTMVESKERKAAFLREATRTLHLDRVEVEVERIESVAANQRLAGTADLITVRAVRVDSTLFRAIGTLLRFGGQALLFGTKRVDLLIPRGFEAVEPQSSLSEPHRLTPVVLNRVGP